jgi:beta-glucanase (GH16 family)
VKLLALVSAPIAAMAIAFACAPAAEAKPVRLVIDSPRNGESVVNRIAIHARLETSRRTAIRRARFYAAGTLIATDKKYPFSTSASSAINTSSLPPGSDRLEISVEYTTAGSAADSPPRTLQRIVRVEQFLPPSALTPLPSDVWRRTFNDNFSSPSRSRSTWETQRDDWIKGPIPYSNLEGAGYRSKNVSISNGTLKISTSRRGAAGFRQSTGSVNTHGAFSFKYGYIESRILVPRCSGCWPAFWMLPRADHWPPEIDIIEYFNTAKQKIPYSAVHWPANNAQRERYFSRRLMITDLDDYIGTWHTYGALWTKGTVQFYIDGVAGPQFSKASRIPHKRMYPIIQLAIGRGYRPAVGSTMQVDHVRVWQRR